MWHHPGMPRSLNWPIFRWWKPAQGVCSPCFAWVFSHFLCSSCPRAERTGWHSCFAAKKRVFFLLKTPKRICFAYCLHLILYAREEIVLVGHCLVQQYQVYENISQKAFSEVNEMVKHQTTLFFRLCPGPVSNLIRCSSFAWGFAHGNQAHQAQPLRIDCEKLSE